MDSADCFYVLLFTYILCSNTYTNMQQNIVLNELRVLEGITGMTRLGRKRGREDMLSMWHTYVNFCIYLILIYRNKIVRILYTKWTRGGCFVAFCFVFANFNHACCIYITSALPSPIQLILCNQFSPWMSYHIGCSMPSSQPGHRYIWATDSVGCIYVGNNNNDISF